MKRLLPLLVLALCTLSTACDQLSRPVPSQEQAAMPLYQTDCEPTSHQERDRLYGAVLSQPDRQGAILADSHRTYRLCSQRPQRLVPTGGGSRWSSSAGLFKRGMQPSVMAYHVTSAPVRRGIPCRYYVFALERMLC